MVETLFPLGISQYVIGGLLVGAGISSIFILTGRVAGASTVLTSVWSFVSKASYFDGFSGSRLWRVVLLFGTVLGGLAYYWFVADGQATITAIHPVQLFVGGVFVGLGTRMAGGCASGHGICGNAFFEKDSLIATVTFLTVGIITALLTSLFI